MITYITISAKHPHNSTITVKHITTTVYTYTNSQKTNSPQIICLYVFVCPPLFFKPSYHVLWMLKTKTKQKTSKFYISTWHDMMWYDMMWRDMTRHDMTGHLQDDLVLQHPAEGGVTLQNVSQRSAGRELHHQQKSRLLCHSHQGDHARVLQAPHDGGLHHREGRCKGHNVTDCLGVSK